MLRSKIMDLYHMQFQPLFPADKLDITLFLAFEIASNIVVRSLKHLFVQQFVANFDVGIQNSVQCDHMRSQPQFHTAVRK